MTNNIRPNLDNFHLTDIYALMLFILYKTQSIPSYAVLSKLCYLVDGNSLSRLLTYFAGQTITFPKEEDFTVLTNALLMYQYVNINGESFANAQAKFKDLTIKQREKITDLYLQIIPLVNEYHINKDMMKHE